MQDRQQPIPTPLNYFAVNRRPFGLGRLIGGQV
jgi:hypothetical protein